MRKFLLLLALIIHLAAYSMEITENKKHFVYHPKYDITFGGIEKVHPFDSAKYSKVAQYLTERNLLKQEDFHQPQEVTDDDLKLVHTPEYLNNLHNCSSAMFAKASEVYPIALVPNFLIRWKALYPMRLATGGTVEATQLALKNGWAINLSGGYHHAKKDSCEGFCIYADIPLAAHKAITEHNINKILVLDLDAHQGNGNEKIFGEEKIFESKVDVFDVYGRGNYPGHHEHQLMCKENWYDHPVTIRSRFSYSINDQEYLKILNDENRGLPHAIEKTKPELIIYNAGSDIYEKDPLGRMDITKEGIIKRDQYVFGLAKEHNIPIIMTLSGGYTSESAAIIGESIENIIKIMETNNEQ